MSASKGFGYKGEPNTCLYCGDPLKFETIPANKETDQNEPGFKIDSWTGYASKNAPVPGYEHNGHFDTLRCGYRFGLRLANLGDRLELSK